DGDANKDGLVGLTRSFFVAGAKAVLASIPDIDDEATEYFMFEFYTNWLFGGEPLPTAVRNAMLSTRTKYSQPDEWGGYLLFCGAFGIGSIGCGTEKPE